MKKAFLLLALLSATALSQGAPPITFREADGSPRKTAPSTIIVSNGTLTCSGSTCTITTGGGGTPGGSDTQIQFNNAGSFGGVSGATSNGTAVTFSSANLLATNPRLTTGILDSAGNLLFTFTATSSAVNGFGFTNAATNNGVVLSAVGSDTNIQFIITPKGTGWTESTGPLRLSGTGSDSWVTPVGISIPTKIHVPLYNPGSFAQILAMGLPSNADTSARVITLADARGAGHQPTLMLLSPDEQQFFGYSWDGSNTVGKIQNSATGGIISLEASGGIQLSSATLTNLGTPSAATMIFCSDCNPNTDPCTSGGTGALAVRANSRWYCP